MVIDCNKYRKTLDSVVRLMRSDDPRSRVSTVAAATHVPVIVVCIYMIQFLYPDNESLKKLEKTLIDFYGYTDIIRFEND